MKEDIRALLRTSDAVLSMGSERRAFESFERQRWDSTQGVIYQDIETNKFRELDILAQQLWRHRAKTHHGITAIRLLVEVKSLAGYHLLFTPTGDHGDVSYSTRFWLGDRDRGRYQWLLSLLEREGFSATLSAELASDFGASLFPRGRRAPRPIAVDPPPAPFIATTFRETNTKITKDLDASVMWRAAASLRSAVQSCFRKQMRINREFVSQAAFFAGADPAKRVEDVRKSLMRQALRVEEHHPVIVFDAQLWKTESASLERIEWCRFVQRDTMGDAVFWCDVVQANALDAYLEVCTKHYERALRRSRAVRFR